jgi:hypothetical protein
MIADAWRQGTKADALALAWLRDDLATLESTTDAVYSALIDSPTRAEAIAEIAAEIAQLEDNGGPL